MGADLILSGHDHTYERMVRHGATYIVDGTGGAKLYKCKANPVYGSKICLDNEAVPHQCRQISRSACWPCDPEGLLSGTVSRARQSIHPPKP
jgi:hypothetical protein